MSNELTDVRCPCGAEFQADSYDAGFIAGSGMCQNCDAALPPKDICTCPSGNGSLRHPCPAHPASVEQAGGDERVIGWRERILAAHPNSDPGFWPDALLVEHMAAEIADLRAALAQPSPVLPPFAEKVLAKLRRFYDCASDFESGGVDIGRHWLDLLTQLGLLNRVQRSPALWEITQQGEDLLGTPQPSPAQAECIDCHGSGFCMSISNEEIRCPCGAPIKFSGPAQAEQAEAERPEVVAYADPIAFATFKRRGHEGGVVGREWMWAEPSAGLVAMSRSDECECIIGELRSERDAANARLHEVATACATAEQQRDAARAKIAELERPDPDYTQHPQIVGYARKKDLGPLLDPCMPDGGHIYIGLDHPSLWSEEPPYEFLTPLYTAPVAQAQPSVPIAPEFKRALGLVVATLEADGDRPTSKYALSELKKVLASAPGKEGL